LEKLDSRNKYFTIDTPSLIIPYYDELGSLVSLQTRYLGEENPNFHIPRFFNLARSSVGKDVALGIATAL